MKYCKNCNAELPEGSTVCPSCGKPVEKKTFTPAKAISLGIVLVVMAFALVFVLFTTRKEVPADPDFSASTPVDGSETPEEETAPATVPEDGDPNNETCKGTYTADDEAVIAARDTVVATAGDFTLTNGQLQPYYWMEVRNFLAQYGSYAAYFGLDYTKPLDTQLCPAVEPQVTWQQYFLGSAINTWHTYVSVAAEADAKGIAIPEAQQAELDNAAEDLKEAAAQYGFSDVDAIIHDSLGAAATFEDYIQFLTLYHKSGAYYIHLLEQIEVSDETLDAFFDEHAEDYAAAGITKDSISVNVRHILVYPEGADGTNIFTEEFSEEAWAAGEAAANALLEQWLAGDKTEESFAALANEHSQDPGSNKNGGLYENVSEGEMVQAFNDWCFDPARQVGDTGVVKTEYGYHVMFFSGSSPKWKGYAESDYVRETANNQISEIAEKNALTIHYPEILLAKAVLK